MSNAVLLIVVLALSGGALHAHARAEFLGAGSTEEFISKLYEFGLGLGGLLAIGAIVTGGILVATSGAVNKQQLGRELITGAIWGLVLLFGAYFLLNTINPQLVKLKAPGITACGGGVTRNCLDPCIPGENLIPGVECYPVKDTPPN